MKEAIIAGSMSVIANLGLIGFLFRWQNGKADKIDKKADDNYKALCNLDDKYLTEKEHGHLCENTELRLEKTFTKELSSLKDDIFESQRKLKDDISNYQEEFKREVVTLVGSLKEAIESKKDN